MDRFPKACVLTILIAILFLLYVFDPSTFLLTPRCPIKLLLGIDCPSCGIQRAIHSFLLGNYREAIRYNYYLVFTLPYAGLIFLNYLIPNGKIKNVCTKIIANKYIVNSYIITYFLWFVVRNILDL